MKFNPNKCKVMHVGNKDSTETPYSVGQGIRSEKLSIANEEKDLGVWFDTGLKFSSHISHTVAKSNQLLGLIKRSFVYKDIQSVKCILLL